MRITLIHNPKAGRRTHRKKELMAALADAGHQTSRAAQKINIDIYRNPAHAVLARLKVPN